MAVGDYYHDSGLSGAGRPGDSACELNSPMITSPGGRASVILSVQRASEWRTWPLMSARAGPSSRDQPPTTEVSRDANNARLGPAHSRASVHLRRRPTSN